MNLGRLIVALALCAAGGAHAGDVSKLADVPDLNLLPEFKIVDQRPASEKTKERLSRLITACDYGITRIGDKNTSPERIPLLRSDLAARLDDGEPKTLRIVYSPEVEVMAKASQPEVSAAWFAAMRKAADALAAAVAP